MRFIEKLLTMALLSSLVAAASSITDITFFPADFQGGHINMNEGNFVPLKTMIFGNGYQLLKLGQPELTISMPDDLELCGASPIHPQHIEAFPIAQDADGAHITLSKEFVSWNIRTQAFWKMGMNIYFRPKKNTAGKNLTLTFQVKGGAQTEFSKTLAVSIVPPLPKANRMKRFRVGHWDLHAIYMPFPEIFDANLKFWTDLCVRPTIEIHGASAYTPKPYLDKIFKQCFTFYGMASTFDTPCVQSSLDFYDKHMQVARPGVPKLIDKDGKEVRNGAICPQYLIEDPEKLFWEHHIPEGMTTAFKTYPGLTAWSIDYESFPEFATCDTCRKAFAKDAKLNAVPTRQEIAPGQPLHKQWRRFRADQRTKIIAKLYDTMKRHFPDKTFRMCTVPITDDDCTASWSAIDTKALDNHVDEFQNMLYCAGKQFFDILEKNIRELKKPQCPLIDPAEQHLRYFNRYTPATVQQNIIAAAAMGCPEICLYPTDYYDANYLKAIIDACNAIQEAEDAYAKPTVQNALVTHILNTDTITLADGDKTVTIPYPNLKPDFRAFLHSDGKNTFATLFNFSQTTPVILKLALPDYDGPDTDVADLTGRLAYNALSAEQIRNGFLVKLPQDGVAVLKFAPSSLATATVSQAKLKAELDRTITDIRKNADIYTPKAEANIGAKWILHKDAPAILLTNCNASLVISPKRGGVVTAWTAPGFGTLLTDCPNSVCQIGEFIPYKANAALPSPIPFVPQDVSLKNGKPAVTLAYTIQPDVDAGGEGNPLERLEIRRTVTLKDWYGTFAITDTLVNHSDKNMTLGFRLKNIPTYSWNVKKRLRYTFDNGKTLPLECTSYLMPGHTIQWEALGTPKTVSKPEITFGWGNKEYTLSLDAKDFIGFYTWPGDAIQTFEPFSPMITLKPGEARSFTMDAISSRSKSKN